MPQVFQGIKRRGCVSTKQFSSTFVAKHLSFDKAGLLVSWIRNSRFGKLFLRQEESGWGLEAADFVCLLHRVLGASKEAKTLWFEHLLQVLLSVNTFLLMSNVCTKYMLELSFLWYCFVWPMTGSQQTDSVCPQVYWPLPSDTLKDKITAALK